MPIDLSITNTPNKSDLNKNKHSIISPLSPEESRAIVRRILETGASESLRRAVGMMLAAGILPQYRIPVSDRTVRLYHKQRILDRLPYVSAEIRATLLSYGLPVPEDAQRSLVYTLGPVGAALAQEMFGVVPASGYLGAPLERLMHDIAVNEVVLRISESALAAGWKPLWSSKYEGTLWKDKLAILEPDAFVRFKKDGQEQAYLIEYHNEDKRTRAAGKVRKYEAAFQSRMWEEQWEVETFPPVLAVYREGIVGKGYNDEVATTPGKVQFFGRSLEGFFQDENSWYDFRKKQKVKIFPWL